MSPSEAPGAEFGPALNGLLAAQRTHLPTLNVSSAASRGCVCFNTAQWPIGHQGLRPRSLPCPMGMRSLRNLTYTGQWQQIPQESALLLHQLKVSCVQFSAIKTVGSGAGRPRLLACIPLGPGLGVSQVFQDRLVCCPSQEQTSCFSLDYLGQ